MHSDTKAVALALAIRREATTDAETMELADQFEAWLTRRDLVEDTFGWIEERLARPVVEPIHPDPWSEGWEAGYRKALKVVLRSAGRSHNAGYG